MKRKRKYKDSIFRSIFNNRTCLLELYNAVKGTKFKDESIIEINTLEDVLFTSIKNDISFKVNGKTVVLIEHQSTIDKKIALRILSYIARIYEKMEDEKIYDESKKVPYPEFIVLYNGKEPFPEKKYFKLSDLYEEMDESELIDSEYPIKLDLIVIMYNINKGFNQNLKSKCKTLNSYSFLIDKIREYEKNHPPDEAAKLAVEYCMKNGILVDYLKKHSAEVVSMSFLEYNLETHIKVVSQVAMEKGIEEGEKRVTYVLKLMEQGFSHEEIKKKLEEMSKNNGRSKK